VRIQGDEINVRARIRSLDLYSGHADAPELAAWAQARLPISRNVFLVHGEESALAGLAARISAFVEPERIVIPRLDDCYELSAAGAKLLDGQAPRRMSPEVVGRLDWHNDLSKLILDIGAQIALAPDDKSKAVVIRRLRRALDER
jgi:metallo-beta-lactamase family protein